MIDKNAWGSSMWNTLHFVALGYPNNPSEVDKKNYKNFYEKIQTIIPCEECSKHLETNLSEIPIDKYLDSKDKLFEWTVLLHNSVNKMLNKSEWSIKKAQRHYTYPLFNLRDSTKCFNNSYFLIILLLIILILTFFIKFKIINLKYFKIDNFKKKKIIKNIVDLV